MGLIQTIKMKFKPSYEVESENFYSKFLNQEDTENLRPFVSDFGDRLSIPSAILAVGSSTLPLSHWDSLKRLNNENPGLNTAKTYNDIDLLILPEDIVDLNQLETAVQDVLSQMDFSFKVHQNTACGVSYRKVIKGSKDGSYKETISSYSNTDYGLHSIETNLKNGTKLDLILGRDGLLEQTISQKISEERKENNAFSLLYQR